MVTSNRLALAYALSLALACSLRAAPSLAEESTPVPRLHHAPRAVRAAHERLLLNAEIDHPELVKRAILAYRTQGTANFEEAEFRRGSPGPYVAEVPASAMNPPGVEYAIELEALDGTRRAVFATRAEPHRIEVPEDLMDARERALMARVHGRRSQFATFGEYVDFGYTHAQSVDGDGVISRQRVHDQFVRVEGSYTIAPCASSPNSACASGWCAEILRCR